MTSTIFFAHTEYDDYLVGGIALKEYSQNGIMSYSSQHLILIKSNLVGLTTTIIDDFLKDIDSLKIKVGVFEGNPCMIGISYKDTSKFSALKETLFDNIQSNWQKFDLSLYSLVFLNSLKKIAVFNKKIQDRLRNDALQNGTYLEDPDTTYLSYDTNFGDGVIVEPNVDFGPNVKIGDNVRIKSFSYIEDAVIGNDAQIGPFARIRGASIIGEDTKIGNFVEIKNSVIGDGSKASHLSYIGDAKIGKKVNIGAGTITCNYDGYKKHITKINDNVFVGSNVTLIAPITIGSNSLIGASSFINEDVPDNTFAIGRSKQTMKINNKV